MKISNKLKPKSFKIPVLLIAKTVEEKGKMKRNHRTIGCAGLAIPLVLHSGR